MFPNEVMGQQKTWNDILGVMAGGARRARVGLTLRGSRSAVRGSAASRAREFSGDPSRSGL